MAICRTALGQIAPSRAPLKRCAPPRDPNPRHLRRADILYLLCRSYLQLTYPFTVELHYIKVEAILSRRAHPKRRRVRTWCLPSQFHVSAQRDGYYVSFFNAREAQRKQWWSWLHGALARCRDAMKQKRHVSIILRRPLVVNQCGWYWSAVLSLRLTIISDNEWDVNHFCGWCRCAAISTTRWFVSVPCPSSTQWKTNRTTRPTRSVWPVARSTYPMNKGSIERLTSSSLLTSPPPRHPVPLAQAAAEHISNFTIIRLLIFSSCLISNHK